MNARDIVLGRIRAALADLPREEPPRDSPASPDLAPVARDYLAVPRDYLEVHADLTPEQNADLLARNLADYRARVHRTDEAALPDTIARIVAGRGSRSAVVPLGLPRAWLTGLTGVEVLTAEEGLTARRLDTIDTVITGCALAIAETGTIVLDAGPDQGPRRLTLVPDHHVCVVRAPGQIVGSLPQALPRLDPVRPQTWISGPSATSDIELDRVEGVHGPRVLDVVVLAG